MKKLYRSRQQSMISGVCGGLAHYLNIDPSIVRILFVFLAFYHFLGVWVYLVLAIILPQAPEGYEESHAFTADEGSTQTTKVIGGGLIMLGILALISSLDIQMFSWFRMANLWPVIIILLGLLLLFRGTISEE